MRTLRTVMRGPLAIIAGLVLVAAGVLIGMRMPTASSTPEAPARGNWVEAWAAAESPPAGKGISAQGLDDQTVRMIVHTSIGGDGLRIRLSDEYGEVPLEIGSATVGLQDTGASVVPGSIHALAFGGDQGTVIPAGAQAYSDPVSMQVSAGENLVVSIYLPSATGPTTWHPHAIQTNYIAVGDETARVDDTGFGDTEESWFYLEGVAVDAPDVRGAVVAFGDSITNGTVSTVDANHRYPDYLAARLRSSQSHLSVVEAGIGGNRILSTQAPYGNKNAESRFVDDAVDLTGARTLIFLEGINDIQSGNGYLPGEPITAGQLISGMKNIIAQAHAKDLTIIGGTITPAEGSARYTDQGEQIREEVNKWIRTSGAFDGVVDFDKAVRDPNRPKQLRPEYDSGGHLHPNDLGYQAMANAVSLALLNRLVP